MRLTLAAFCLVALANGVALRQDDTHLSQSDSEFCDGLKYLLDGGNKWVTTQPTPEDQAKKAAEIAACKLQAQKDKEKQIEEAAKAQAAKSAAEEKAKQD